MIVLTVWNDGETKRTWIKEYEKDAEPKSAIHIETLLDWEEEGGCIGNKNRIRVDRLIIKGELHKS